MSLDEMPPPLGVVRPCSRRVLAAYLGEDGPPEGPRHGAPEACGKRTPRHWSDGASCTKIVLMTDGGPPPGRRPVGAGNDEIGSMTVHPRRRHAHRREALVVLVAAALAAVTTWLAPHPVSGLLLWLALVYVYGLGGLLVLRALDARRRAQARRGELEHDRTVPLAEVVEAAVREERRRLALDIRRVLLEVLTDIRERSEQLLAGARGEPELAAAVGTLRARTQLATSELRRLLGILRVAEDEQDPDAAVGTAPRPTPTLPARPAAADERPDPAPQPLVHGRPRRREVVETVVVVGLAALECVVNLPGRLDGPILLPLLATVLAAALFVGRSVAPVVTALAQGLTFATAAVLGAPVMSGVWMVRGVGAVIWRSGATLPHRQGVPAALLLAVTVVASRHDEPPLGVATSWAVVLVALAGGIATAVTRHRAAVAAHEAAAIREAARAEIRVAVMTERLRLARELHDTVSHSVGVIAMQLNVLDVVDTAEGRRQALASIHETSSEALRDLTDLDVFPGGTDPLPSSRTLDDVAALVQRVRGAGARVDLSVVGVPEPGHMSVVYRLLQEALTNALQHAPAASVQVLVAAGPEGTHLVVQDDGPGPGAGTRPAHYGMIGLRERVALAGGTLDLGSRGDDGGFQVSAHLPPAPTISTQEVPIWRSG